MLVGIGSRVDLRLLTAILPDVEAAILAPPEGNEGGDDGD